MISPKSVLVFVSGCGAGIALTMTLLNPGTRAQASTMLAGPFADVPANHVAATAVSQMKAEGIIKGYPDNTYHGGEPVTRYELAVTLARFAKYYDTSKQPLSNSSVSLPKAPEWAAPSREYLAANAYLPPFSPILSDPGKAKVTADQLGDGIAYVVDRINDRSNPPQKQ